MSEDRFPPREVQDLIAFAMYCADCGIEMNDAVAQIKLLRGLWKKKLEMKCSDRENCECCQVRDYQYLARHIMEDK